VSDVRVAGGHSGADGHVIWPVPAEVTPEVGMVVVMPYDLMYMCCPTLTVFEVDGDNVAMREDATGIIRGWLSWRRRFQRIGVNRGELADQEFASPPKAQP